MIQEISAIAYQCVSVDPIQAAQQQVIWVHQIITNCRKMPCESHKHHTSSTAIVYNFIHKTNNNKCTQGDPNGEKQNP